MSQLAKKLIGENKIRFEQKEDARHLDLGNCGLTSLPIELFDCKWIERLVLSSKWNEWNLETETWETRYSQNPGEANRIDQVPDEMKKLINLKDLIIVGDWQKKWGIDNIGPLGSLSNLEMLYLGYTHVHDLSPLQGVSTLKQISINNSNVSDISYLNKMSNLKEIDVRNTPVSDISVLSELDQIIKINISFTQVNNINCLYSSKNLKHLDISFTKITDISPLRNLNKLQTLDISNTKVSDLRSILTLIQKSVPVLWDRLIPNAICVKNCPLTIPPPEIIRQGKESMLRYFVEIERGGVDQIYEAKLIIIGEGGAGKTSLRRKILDPNASLPQEEETTLGIDIEPLYFELPDGKQFRINIWDFGGQGKYQAAHNFFYTRRSLYVFVDDTRTMHENEAYRSCYNYWLQTAEIFGDGSPLIIVHNQKAGRNRVGFNLGEFQEKFNFVKELYCINLKDNNSQTLKKLISAVYHEMRYLPHVGDTVPKSWVLVREDLEELRRLNPYISQKQFFEVCEKHNISNEKVQLDLSSYLHDLGVFLHYQDSPILKHYVFLQNEWTTGAVYKILDDQNIIEINKGRFTTNDLKRVWNEKEYARRSDELLELIKKFELCFPVENSNIFVSPQLLPGNPPFYTLGGEKLLQMKYQYAFMPKGLLHRLIVRMHRDIADNQQLVWNNGVILERQETRAEIRETLDKQIHIQAFGKYPKEMMTIIIHELDRLNSGYGDRLKVEKFIPCICSFCESNPRERDFHDYNLLLRRSENGKHTVDCKKGKNEDVAIDALLDNVLSKSTHNFLPELNIETIRRLISLSETQDALTKLIGYFPYHAELHSQLAIAERDYLLGRTTVEDFFIVRQRVNVAVLSWLKQYESK